MMPDAKPWWASKTLIANGVALIAAVCMGFGIDLGLDENAQSQLVLGISAVINIGLRIVTTQPVTAKRKAAPDGNS